jgi:hypothetical protein
VDRAVALARRVAGSGVVDVVVVEEDVGEDVGFEFGQGAGFAVALQGAGDGGEPVVDRDPDHGGDVRTNEGHAIGFGGEFGAALLDRGGVPGGHGFGVQPFPGAAHTLLEPGRGVLGREGQHPGLQLPHRDGFEAVAVVDQDLGVPVGQPPLAEGEQGGGSLAIASARRALAMPMRCSASTTSSTMNPNRSNRSAKKPGGRDGPDGSGSTGSNPTPVPSRPMH